MQFTPPGSWCSLQFGNGLASGAAGGVQEAYLVVPSIETARSELIARGVEASAVFHRGAAGGRLSGPDPRRQSYNSLVSFADPDGNNWLVQEVTVRLPGRVNAQVTGFASAAELAGALRRAESAHAEHESRTGQRDAHWADWYADYISREQAGKELPV